MLLILRQKLRGTCHGPYSISLFAAAALQLEAKFVPDCRFEPFLANLQVLADEVLILVYSIITQNAALIILILLSWSFFNVLSVGQRHGLISFLDGCRSSSQFRHRIAYGIIYYIFDRRYASSLLTSYRHHEPPRVALSC